MGNRVKKVSIQNADRSIYPTILMQREKTKI